MPLTEQNTVNDFTPVTTGDMSELRPNIKEGKYRGTFECTPKKTKEKGYPMLEIKITVTEALDGADETEIGRTSNDYLVFGPEDGKGVNMQKRKAKEYTDGFDLPPCDTSGFVEGGEGWETLRAWIETLEAENENGGRIFWVKNPPDRVTNEPQTDIHALEPGKTSAPASAAGKDLDDDDKAEAPAKASSGGGKGKTNGTAKKGRR